MKKIILLAFITVCSFKAALSQRMLPEATYLQNEFLPVKKAANEFNISVVMPDFTTKIIKNTQLMETFKNDNEALLRNFPYVECHILVEKNEASGEASFATNKLSVKGESYNVYMIYNHFNIYNQDDNSFTAKVGFSLKFKASFVSKKGDINIGNFLGLGISASKSKIKGNLTTATAGIISKELNAAIPASADITEGTIANFVQALNVVKTTAYNPQTAINPQILEIKNNTGTPQKVDDVLNGKTINLIYK